MTTRVVNAGTVSDELIRPTKKLAKQFNVGILLASIKNNIKVKTKIVDVEYNKDYEKDIKNLSLYLKTIFGKVVYDEKKKEILVTGNQTIKVKFTVKKPPSTSRAVIDTKVQEEGTTVVLNQVLHKNKKFNKKEDILADKDTADQLKKLFGRKYEDRLEEWTHSYFEHKKNF